MFRQSALLKSKSHGIDGEEEDEMME